MFNQYKADIDELLDQSDIQTVSGRSIRKQLEEKLGIDLSDYKKELTEFVIALVKERSQEPPESRRYTKRVKIADCSPQLSAFLGVTEIVRVATFDVDGCTSPRLAIRPRQKLARPERKVICITG